MKNKKKSMQSIDDRIQRIQKRRELAEACNGSIGSGKGGADNVFARDTLESIEAALERARAKHDDKDVAFITRYRDSYLAYMREREQSEQQKATSS